MVSPITDVRPWVLGFDHLVVDSLVGDAVGVVAVCRGGVEEFRDDMVDEQRIAVRERFPVLEYIAPVTLVRHDRLAVLVLHTNAEQVPRTGGVSVPTTKGQGQVLRVGSRRIGQVVTAAHGVEQHVRKMTCIVRLVSGLLDSVVLRHDAFERLGRFVHRLLDLLDRIGSGDEMHEVVYRYGVLAYVQYVVPSLRTMSRQLQVSLSHKSSTYSLGRSLIVPPSR